MKNLLIAENSKLSESGVYIAYIILDAISKKERISVFELYDLLKKRMDNVNYTNVMDALSFLRMIGLIKFNAPYFSKLQ